MDAQELRAELEGTLVDRYQVEHELGAGGMARVFAARDLRHQRRVAIKVLRTEVAAGFGADRFLREINLTASLQHPHILALLDSGTLTIRGLSVPYYVMPLVAGLSLRARLSLEGKLAWPEALALISDVGQALAFAHEHGIVHRDIKPENLLASESGAIQVADFGVARTRSSPERQSLTGEGVSLGTPLYMSPEQAFGDGDVDARSDQYSLATVFFELVTGHAPYLAPTKEAILARRLVEPVPSPLAIVPELPVGFEPVLRRAMARQPADRYPSVTEFVAALVDAGASPPGEVRPAARPARRSSWNRWLVGAVTVIAIGGGLGLAVRRGRAKPATRPIVAVIGFENLTSDSLLEPVGRVTADWIVQGLAETGVARVVSQQTTSRGDQKDRASGAGPTGRAQRIGRIVGATLLVTGSYRVVQDSLAFTVQMIDAATGEVRHALGPINGPKADPSRTADRVRDKVLGAIAVLSDAGRSAAIAKIASAPSYPAYREYIRATELENQGHTRESARVALKAYRMDTTSMLPLTTVIGAAIGLGDIRFGDSLLKMIERRSAELSPVERAYFGAMRATLSGDWQAAANGFRTVDSIVPGDGLKSDIATIESFRNRMGPALSILEQCNLTDGVLAQNETVWVLMSVLRHRLGRYREALEGLRQARRFHPSSQRLNQAEIEQLAALGRFDQVDSALTVVRELPEVDFLNESFVWADVAAELTIHGYPDHARVVAQRGLDWLGQTSHAGQVSALSAKAYLLMEVDRWSEVIPIVDSLRHVNPEDLFYIGSEAIGLRRVNRPAAADSLAAQMMATKHGSPGEREFTMARIAAARGAPEEAVSWLQRALANGFRAIELKFHIALEFASLRGRPDFEATIRPRE